MHEPYSARRSPTIAPRLVAPCVVAISVGCGLGACMPPESDTLPIVARGRYVELATDREDPICGGTVAFLDAFLEAGFRAIDEEPPDDVFVRYEWRPDTDVRPRYFLRDGMVVIRSARIADEHELTHAVHSMVWPQSAPFLQEGLATLFDPFRNYNAHPRPTVGVLDAAIGAASGDEVDYRHAWYIVGQIVYEHGVGGLRDLWHAVPPGASASEVRATYEGLFGSSIETLFEPWIYTGELTDGEPDEIERYACEFSLCPAAVRPYDDDGLWSGGAPFSCADDPDAVGPATRDPWVDPLPVWREYSLQRESPPFYTVTQVSPDPLDPPRWLKSPCFPACSGNLPRYEQPPPDYVPLGTHGRFRIQIGAELEDLPSDGPPQLVLR